MIIVIVIIFIAMMMMMIVIIYLFFLNLEWGHYREISDQDFDVLTER